MNRKLRDFQIESENVDCSDDFNDSTLHERWTVETPGSTTAVEGADGIVLVNPSGSNDDPRIIMDLPGDMHLRNWTAQVHMEISSFPSPGDALSGQVRITGQGGGSEKYMQALFIGTTGPSYKRAMQDNTSSQETSVSGANLWVRLRRFDNEIRMDYYEGAHTVDVDNDGYWIEYDSSKTWYTVPKDGTYDYPIKYDTLMLRLSQWGANPGGELTLRKFKLRIF